MSASSAANSTPVGPPPQTTNDKSFFLSPGEVVGSEASSRLATDAVSEQDSSVAVRLEEARCELTHDSTTDSLGIRDGL